MFALATVPAGPDEAGGPPPTNFYELRDNLPRTYAGVTNTDAAGCSAYAGTSTFCANPNELQSLRNWLAAVRSGCTTRVQPCWEPLVSFGRPREMKLNDFLPSPAEYRAAIVAFRAMFPWITRFTAWNEPNDPNQPTSTARSGAIGPKRAGQYYRELKTLCGSRCAVAAGDFADNGTLTAAYFKAYNAGTGTAARRKPAWAYHAYMAGFFQTLSGVRDPQAKFCSAASFRSFLRWTSNPHGRDPRIWITEVGGMVRRYEINKYDCLPGELLTPQAEAEARADLEFLLDDLISSTARITRFYLYEWVGTPKGGSFDSGLARANVRREGEPDGHWELRPAYFRLQEAHRAASGSVPRADRAAAVRPAGDDPPALGLHVGLHDSRRRASDRR